MRRGWGAGGVGPVQDQRGAVRRQEQVPAACGLWSMVYGPRLWLMVYGLWFMVYGL